MYVFIYEHKFRHYLRTDSTVCIRLYTKSICVCVLGNKAPIAYACNSYFTKIIKNKFDNNGIILIIIKLLLLLVHYYILPVTSAGRWPSFSCNASLSSSGILSTIENFADLTKHWNIFLLLFQLECFVLLLFLLFVMLLDYYYRCSLSILSVQKSSFLVCLTAVKSNRFYCYPLNLLFPSMIFN